MKTIKDKLRILDIKIPLTKEMMDYYLSLGCIVVYKYKGSEPHSYAYFGSSDKRAYNKVPLSNVRCLTISEIKQFIQRPEDEISKYFYGRRIIEIQHLYTDYE